MKRKLPFVMIPLVVLLGAAVLGGDGAPVAGSRAISQESIPAGASGMRLYVDPATGEFLEEPLEGESVQMSAEEMAPFFSTSEVGLVEEEAPGGGVMINLKGRFQQAFTARIDETGAVVYDCDRADHAEESDSQVEKEGR
jgi:hypothetical protein